MLRLTLGALLLAGAAPLAAQTVEVAEGDWAGVPPASVAGKFTIGQERMAKIEKIVEAGDCPAAGNKHMVDLKAPFMLQYDADGALQRVVVQRMGCPELEKEIGGAVLDLAKIGEYKPTGVNAAGWYRGELAFVSRL
jgi:hypothetical protein